MMSHVGMKEMLEVNEKVRNSAAIQAEVKEVVLGKTATVVDPSDGKTRRTMHFEWIRKGPQRSTGYTLFIALHGGGGGSAATNDSQYVNHQRLYHDTFFKNDPVIWLTPRSVEDVWNMWHLPYIDLLLRKIIRAFIACGLVMPLRVHLSGFSAGGDGAYKLARMADCFASIMMCAGHPNGASLLPLRNTLFGLYCGSLDGAYDRNKVAGQTLQKLVAYRKWDCEGYNHFGEVVAGKGHWMDQREGQGFIRVLGEVAKLPSKVVWHQCPDNPSETFSWLAVPPAAKIGGVTVRGQIFFTEAKGEADSKITFVIRANPKVKSLRIRVSPYLVTDCLAPVEIIWVVCEEAHLHSTPAWWSSPSSVPEGMTITNRLSAPRRAQIDMSVLELTAAQSLSPLHTFVRELAVNLK